MAIACTVKDCSKEANYGFKTGPRALTVPAILDNL